MKSEILTSCNGFRFAPGRRRERRAGGRSSRIVLRSCHCIYGETVARPGKRSALCRIRLPSDISFCKDRPRAPPARPGLCQSGCNESAPS